MSKPKTSEVNTRPRLTSTLLPTARCAYCGIPYDTKLPLDNRPGQLCLGCLRVEPQP